MLPVYSIVSKIKFIVKFNHNVEIMLPQGKQCVITGLQHKKKKGYSCKTNKKTSEKAYLPNAAHFFLLV